MELPLRVERSTQLQKSALMDDFQKLRKVYGGLQLIVVILPSRENIRRSGENVYG